MKIYLITFFTICLLFTSCKSTKPDPEPPSITTAAVVKSLKDTQQELEEIGLENSKIGVNIDRALTLAERLTILLDKIEEEQKKYIDKTVILPEKL
jgi:hypothetical protein